jgi:hypothetical protein
MTETVDYREVTVRERIEELLDHADRVHGIEVHDRFNGRIFGVVAYTTKGEHVEQCPSDDMDVIDYRSIVIDLDEHDVRLTSNGLWVPANAYNATEITRLAARVQQDTKDRQEPERDCDRDLLTLSAIADCDADLVMDRTLKVRDGPTEQDVPKMRRHPGIDPERAWGYGGGAPPEIETMHDRLAEADLETDRFIRLEYGKKSPWERANGELSEARPASEIMDNYGVASGFNDSGLVILDVDYPEAFPADEVPDTFSVTSPHGSDERKHLFLKCEEKEQVRDELGGWAVQFGSFGEIYVGGRYVVGPGSQLSAYGCDLDDHEAGDAEACDRCSDPEGGYYRVADDRPIAEVDADLLLELAAVGMGEDDDQDDGELEDDQDGRDDEHGIVRCAKCERRGPRRKMEKVTVLGNEHWRHEDGCPDGGDS